MDVVVLAKVWKFDEDEVPSYESEIPERQEKTWGRMSILVDDIKFYYTQSNHRCVIKLKSGEIIFVSSRFEDLKTQIDEVRQMMIDIQLEEVESDEEELILGEENEEPPAE